MASRWQDPILWLDLKRRLGLLAGALAVLLIFGGVGYGASYVVVGTLSTALRSGEWARVPAHVQRAEDGSYTYRYTWQGREYASDKVGTFAINGSSEVDDWEPRMEFMLSQAVDKQQPLMAYVNPADPREALLNREVRWFLLLFFLPFAVGFSLAGLGISLALGAQACGWKARGPMLKDKARGAVVTWVMTAAWNAISVPIAILAVPDMWRQGEYLFAGLVSIFVVIGALLLWGALKATWNALREGNPFNPDFFGFAPGGPK